MRTIRKAHRELRGAILHCARADAIPEGDSGLWRVQKYRLAKPFRCPRYAPNNAASRIVTIPRGQYTQLWRMRGDYHEELVMQDTPDELDTHLEFMMKAFGKVLVTGLGLGCVVRGLLENERVESITVIERDVHVLKLVRPYMPKTDRLEIVEADARDWVKKTDSKFHCAWHDLWSDEDNGDPHLQVMHAEIVSNLAERVVWQGAWAMPRQWKRAFRLMGRGVPPSKRDADRLEARLRSENDGFQSVNLLGGAV